MHNPENSILESVIRFTEERDKKSLAILFIQELMNLKEVEHVILLDVPPVADGKLFKVSETSSKQAIGVYFNISLVEKNTCYIETEPHLEQLIELQSPLTDGASDDKTQRAFFPITLNKNIHAILCIYGNNLCHDTIRSVTNMIAIYNNFLGVIDDGERDSLTRLFNRKTFDLQLAYLVRQATSNLPALSSGERRKNNNDTFHWIGILDIDHFKSINDNYGHMYGDEVLLLFSTLLRDSFRSSDLLFRYGGEEFIVVLAPAREQDAVATFERFREKLTAFNFPQVGQVTASIGMVKMDTQHHTTTLLDHADQALYYAKENGRNQVCNYTTLVEQGLLEEKDMLNDVEMF